MLELLILLLIASIIVLIKMGLDRLIFRGDHKWMVFKQSFRYSDELHSTKRILDDQGIKNKLVIERPGASTSRTIGYMPDVPPIQKLLILKEDAHKAREALNKQQGYYSTTTFYQKNPFTNTEEEHKKTP